MFKNDCCHWVRVSAWGGGGFHHKASILLAAVNPAIRVQIQVEDRFSDEVSFKSSILGEHGTSASNRSDKVEDTNFQKDATSGHSQYVCRNDPTQPREHRSQTGEWMSFIKYLFLGIRYILCKNLKCISLWIRFFDVSS